MESLKVSHHVPLLCSPPGSPIFSPHPCGIPSIEENKTKSKQSRKQKKEQQPKKSNRRTAAKNKTNKKCIWNSKLRACISKRMISTWQITDNCQLPIPNLCFSMAQEVSRLRFIFYSFLTTELWIKTPRYYLNFWVSNIYG